MSEDDILDDSQQEPVTSKYAITSYGVDYPIDGLVQRLQDNTIFMPSFQRDYVWKRTEAAEFVESLLLGLPVPGIFMARDSGTQRLLVIDGQQRLKTLRYFFEGAFPDGKTFSINIQDSPYENSTYDSLDDGDKIRLNDTVLHATIVRQDLPEDNQNSIYMLFERLNTGAVILQPQEIRIALYHGELIDTLRNLNLNSYWRTIFGPKHLRARDEELILRFFALYYRAQVYSSPMKTFLNNYANLNRHLTLQSSSQLTALFESTIKLANDAIGSQAFRPVRALNAAAFDAVMVALARRLEKGPITNMEGVRTKYSGLMANLAFKAAIETSTSDPERVRTRIMMASTAFADVI
jgi:hypothetical protein